MNVDNLDGRELDLAIAYHVFGELAPTDDGTEWCSNCDGTYQGEVLIDGCASRSWEVVEWPSRYHENDYFAFQVVDKIMGDKLPSFCLDSIAGGWYAEFDNMVMSFDCKAKTRPLAICRAALKAVCNDKS